MSHFVTAVFTKTGLDTELKRALQPFHEFECTGTNDEYIQDVDVTEETWNEYMNHTSTMMKMPDGSLEDFYDNRFYREMTPEEKKDNPYGFGSHNGVRFTSADWGDGQGYRAKAHFIPEGCEKVDIPMSEKKSFLEFIEGWHGIEGTINEGEKPDIAGKHKYGYVVLSEGAEKQGVLGVFKRTNPNKHWDWWVIGGRWNGRLLDKQGKSHNALRLKDWDFETSIKTETQNSVDLYNRFEMIVNGRSYKTWDELKTEHEDMQIVREQFHNQEVCQDLCKDNDLIWIYYDMINLGKEAWIKKNSFSNVVPFAFVDLKGNWHEKGKMGWWGIVTDEKESEDWNDHFVNYVRSLDQDTIITCVDCHI